MTTTATGTAAGYLDFIARLRDFAVAGLPVGERWTLLAGPASGSVTTADELIFEGPLSNGQRPRWGMRPYTATGENYWNVGLVGLTSYNPGAALLDQVNRTAPRMLLLADNPMAYRLIGNGRHIKGWVRNGALYEHFYVGFGLPQAFPDDYPYPMVCGAMTSVNNSLASVQGSNHRAYWDPGDGSLIVCLPGGMWQAIVNRGGGTQDYVESDRQGVAPWHPNLGPVDVRETLDGAYVPQMSLVMCTSPFDATLMHLEGVHFVPGFGNSPEAGFTLGGKTFECVPDAYRSGNEDWCALEIS